MIILYGVLSCNNSKKGLYQKLKKDCFKKVKKDNFNNHPFHRHDKTFLLK